MVKKNYLEDAYIDGLNKEQIEFMEVYNLKEVSVRMNISYYLLRKAVKGKKIPRSVYKDILSFIDNVQKQAKDLK